MAIKIITISLATAFLTVGCVAFPDDGYYDGRYDRRDRGYDYRYDQDRRYDRQRWEYEQQRKRLELERRKNIQQRN